MKLAIKYVPEVLPLRVT